MMPDTLDTALRDLDRRLSWIPPWAVSLALFALAALTALFVHRLVYRLLSRLVAGRDLFWRSLVARTEGPTRLAILILFLAVAASVAPLSNAQGEMIRHGLQLCFIALLGWVAHTALHIWTTVYLRRFKLDAEDNLLARKHVTQSRILQRVLNVLIVLVSIAAILMTFEGVRQYGVSLLASAGAAGIVAGLALQPVLKNIFAGIQLAVTQPIRIDDALIVEGEWGNVEEITATYVVLRLWDWRRLILPLSYFIEQPFQNWTREGAALIGTVMLYLDHRAPMDALRAKVVELARANRLWDRQVVAVQVTDFREQVMEVRILVSASNAPKAFDLRCEMREAVIGWLQAEHPYALPRVRADVEAMPEREAWVLPAGTKTASA